MTSGTSQTEDSTRTSRVPDAESDEVSIKPGRRIPDWLWTLLGRTLVRWYFKLFYRVTLIRDAPVPRTGALIVVSNHQSHFDPPMVGVLLAERPLASLARASLFRNPFFGRFIRYLRAIPLRLGRSDTAAMKEGLQCLKHGEALLIFPEGSRTPDGALHPFQRGTLLMLRRAKAPVLPVAIEGAYDAWPQSRNKPHLFGRIALKSGRVIPYDELMQEGEDHVLERLREEIERLRMDLRDELRTRTSGRYPAPSAGDTPYWDR